MNREAKFSVETFALENNVQQKISTLNSRPVLLYVSHITISPRWLYESVAK